MKTDNRLLAQRNALKDKKPTFIREDSHKVDSLREAWRAPRGQHSKMRRKLRGYRRQPTIGWSSPRAVRSLTPEGYPIILVSREKDIVQAKGPVTIARTVGLKKQIQLLRKALQLKIRVLNVKDPEAYIKGVEQNLVERREAKKSKITKKQRAAEAAKKAAGEKQKVESSEERALREKEEKRKILEQK